MLVFIAVPGGAVDPAVLAEQFGLTGAEAAVAAGLVAGETIEAMAGGRRVSRETVRGQVKSVMAKAQVRSQGQLVGVLSRSLAALRRGR